MKKQNVKKTISYEKPQIVKLSNDVLKDASCLAGRGSGCSWK